MYDGFIIVVFAFNIISDKFYANMIRYFIPHFDFSFIFFLAS